jgi:hypothetical protein
MMSPQTAAKIGKDRRDAIIIIVGPSHSHSSIVYLLDSKLHHTTLQTR